MNRRNIVTTAVVAIVVLSGAVGVFGAFGLTSLGAGPADAPSNTSTDTQSTAATPDTPTDEDVKRHTSVVSTTKELTLEAIAGEVIRGETPLAEGTDLTLRVRSVDSHNPYVHSTDAVVQGDGTFRSAVDLSSAEPGDEVLVTVLRDGRELANRTATVVAHEPATSLDYEDDVLTLRNATDQVVSGSTDLEPGTEVAVRLRSSGEQPFLKQRTATVQEDGSFEATFDLADVKTGGVTITVFYDGDQLATVSGEVVESE